MAQQVALRRRQEQDKKYGPPRNTETSLINSHNNSTSSSSVSSCYATSTDKSSSSISFNSSPSLQAPDISGSGLPSDLPLPLDLSKNQSMVNKCANLLPLCNFYRNLYPPTYYTTSLATGLSSFPSSSHPYFSSSSSLLHLANPPLVNNIFTSFLRASSHDTSSINHR